MPDLLAADGACRGGHVAWHESLHPSKPQWAERAVSLHFLRQAQPSPDRLPQTLEFFCAMIHHRMALGMLSQ
eukprot:765903-Hanusia_phi.AAC.4